jgi:enoyl-CoA hydratase/carnithine racemase
VERDDPTVQSDVLLTERLGNVLVLTLNRPEVRNALNPELKDRLTQEMREADADPGIRAVVITGNGPVFCAGMDLKAFAQGADFGGLVWLYREGIGKPVIGALNGPALAGKIAENAPLSVAITKKLMRERRWGTDEETSAVFRSGDAMEGARAFAERRTPVWTGK